MTLGNVSIEQIEQEWNADKTALQDFTQAKPLYPYVGEFGWENTEEDGGAYRRFTMNNVVDKYVSVKNTGESDAYVRTIVALEMGDYSRADFDMVGISANLVTGEYKFEDAWVLSVPGVIEVDGNNYYVMQFVHTAAVKPEETTIPSLLQVYLSKDSTNETCEKLDGNDSGTYDILVVSQAVQAAGFSDAATALNTAFGEISQTNNPWIVTVPLVNEPFVQNLEATEAYTVDGDGKTYVGVASSADEFQWNGNTPVMSTVFSSEGKTGATATVNDITFTGTMSAVMAGEYVNSSSNWFNTEFNNVNIIDAEVISFSSGISPALCVYGNMTMNNCEMTGTTLSELDTDPMWPVYDVAVVNYSNTVINNSEIGSLYMWNQAKVTVADGSEIGTIVIRGDMNATKYGLVVEAGATVGTIDLSAITNVAKVNITIEDGATVGAFVDNGVEYATLDEWKAAQ